MAQQLAIQATRAVAIDGLNPNVNEKVSFSTTSNNGIVYAPAAGYEKKLLVKFSDISDAAKASVLRSLSFSVSTGGGSAPDIFTVRVISENFDPDTVTWNTRPATYDWSESEFTKEDWTYSSVQYVLQKEILGVYDDWPRITNAIAYGLEISCGVSGNLSSPNGFRIGSNFLKLNYDAITTTVGGMEPQEGAYINKYRQNTFSWGTTDNGLVGNPPEEYKPSIQSGVFLWKEGGTENTLSATSATSITVPANTFSADSVMWAAKVQLDNGEELQSDWATLTTVEALSTAIAVAPANTVVDGATDTTFTWEHVIETGTPPTGYDVQVDSGGDNWHTISSGTGSETSAVVPGGNLEGGNLLWRVRTYNSDGTPGEWSAPLQILVIAAPNTPVLVTESNAPKFEIRWQQSGQQAYELMVDGAVIAKAHSAEAIYRHDGYLEPGTHTVQVRIQNKYQLWSNWASASLKIENVEDESILLTASGGNEVFLRWHTSGAYDSYILYRNGVKIGETATAAFTDHFAVGEVSYQVRGVYRDRGYYTLSNIETVTIIPGTLTIAAIDNPVWIPLPLSTSSLRSMGLSASQSVTYTHFIGRDLPIAEIGEAVSRTYDLECAWKASDREAARHFESLLGKAVCVKTPSQRRIIGVVSQMSVRENRFYVTYTVPITEVRLEGL